jgi:hypothetical protein
MHFQNDGRLLIDNNLVEIATKPFDLGRNNWLFAVLEDYTFSKKEPLPTALMV